MALLLAGALLVRLPRLTQSLWYDEVCYTSVFLRTDRLSNLLFRDVHPPLYALFMYAWTALFGDGELAMRLPSLLFGLASIVILFSLVSRWLGRKAAWLASGLMAASPVHIWYCDEAKTNMLLLLLILGAVHFLVKAWLENRARDWILFAAAGLAALWTNVFAAWVVAAIYAWLLLQLLREKDRFRLRPVLASGIAIFFGWLPFVLLSLSHAGALERDYLRPFTPADAWSLFMVYLSHGNTLRTLSPYEPLRAMLDQPKALFLVEGFFLLLAAAGLLCWIRECKAGRAQAGASGAMGRGGVEILFLWLVLSPLLVMAASLVYRRLYIERSMIILLPPFLTLIACGVLLWRSPLARKVLLTVLLGMNGWALVDLLVVKADVWTVYKQKPDWQSAAAWLAGEYRDSGGGLFILHTTPGEALDYGYSRLLASMPRRGAGVLPASLPHGRMGEYNEESFAAFLGQYRLKRVYLIHERTWSQNFASLMASLEASPRLAPAGKGAFRDLDIYRFDVRPGR